MNKIRSYRDLEIWSRGMELAKRVYVLTRSLPREEMFGLSSQMRRAAVSIPSNIAEGHAKSTATYRNQLVTAIGSLAELDTQLELTRELYPALAETVVEIMRDSDTLSRKTRTLLQRLPEY